MEPMLLVMVIKVALARSSLLAASLFSLLIMFPKLRWRKKTPLVKQRQYSPRELQSYFTMIKRLYNKHFYFLLQNDRSIHWRELSFKQKFTKHSKWAGNLPCLLLKSTLVPDVLQIHWEATLPDLPPGLQEDISHQQGIPMCNCSTQMVTVTSITENSFYQHRVQNSWTPQCATKYLAAPEVK